MGCNMKETEGYLSQILMLTNITLASCMKPITARLTVSTQEYNSQLLHATYTRGDGGVPQPFYVYATRATARG